MVHRWAESVRATVTATAATVATGANTAAATALATVAAVRCVRGTAARQTDATVTGQSLLRNSETNIIIRILNEMENIFLMNI